jgi:transaldolase
VATVIDEIHTKIFADGADLDGILKLADDPLIRGFTTNPTLMWKAGLTDYAEFAQRLLERITAKPISFEVFADDEAEMRRQALTIAAARPSDTPGTSRAARSSIPGSGLRQSQPSSAR